MEYRSFKIEEPGDIDLQWFQDNDRVGISGGASTPHWQLEEIKDYLEQIHFEKNPKG